MLLLELLATKFMTKKNSKTTLILTITTLIGLGLLGFGFIAADALRGTDPAGASQSGGVSPGNDDDSNPGCKTKKRYSAQWHNKWTAKLVRGTSLPARAKRRHKLSVQCAKGPNHRKVMKKRWKAVKRSIKPLPANHDLWVRIGRCEQPGPGYRGVNWSHPGPTYQGGLGFWYGTWDGYKPSGYPADAGQATWRQQMIVANRVMAAVGVTAWGCA
jgi:hypothetical protein